jgi:hypothetical protein
MKKLTRASESPGAWTLTGSPTASSLPTVLLP